MVRRAALFAVLALAACSKDPDKTPVVVDDQPLPECLEAGADPLVGSDGLPIPLCNPGTRWAAGTQAFAEATTETGLKALAVEGYRVTVTDLDGDGWADLVVRRGAAVSEYDAVPPKLNVRVLRNDHGSFVDVTRASGFYATRTAQAAAISRPGEVVAFGDVDNDGDLDGYTGLNNSSAYKTFGETSELMLNDGTGKFSLASPASALRRFGQRDTVGGASFVDYDLDGNLDLWVGETGSDNYMMQSRLYQGSGRGGFSDVTTAAGLTTKEWTDGSGNLNLADVNGGLAHANSWSSAACDLNGDGYPELLLGSYGRAPNLLFQAVPGATVTYKNRALASGYAFDSNQDWTDNYFARCYCAANRTAPGCGGLPTPLDCGPGPYNWNHDTDREAFRLGGNNATAVCADLDNDGDLDLLTTTIKHEWAGENSDPGEVLVNSGEPDVRFTRPGRASMGIVVPHDPTNWDEGIMTAAVFDFDNDGWPDFYFGGSDYPGNVGLLYHQTAPLKFESVPVKQGIDHHRSHGVAVADFDRDGDLDVVVGNSPARCNIGGDCYPTQQVRFFRNVMPAGNWLQLDLRGAAGTNRLAIGARVTVKAGGVTQTQEVGGGHGHYGIQQDRVLHFGLGAATSAEVTVRWPNKALTTETFKLPAGYRFKVEQGQPPAVAEKN